MLPDEPIIHRFSMKLSVKTKRKNKFVEINKDYLIMVEVYDGFGFLKFHPRDFKKHPDKYRFRGAGKAEDCNRMNFSISRAEMLRLLNECIRILKLLLDKYDSHLLGFIGMVDKFDNADSRRNSSRFKVYQPFVLSSPELQSKAYYRYEAKALEEINCMMLIKGYEHEATKEVEENAQKFIGFLLRNSEQLGEFMTVGQLAEVRKRVKQQVDSD